MGRRLWMLGVAACVDASVASDPVPAASDTAVAGPDEASDPSAPLPPGGEPPVADDTGTAPVDSPPPPDAPVRFIALGDAGEGNSTQYAVAQGIGTVCAARGCDFALYLGDNFYDGGVYAVDDEQFETKFELPYADLDLEFFVVLGNHDFGEIPFEFWRTDFQVDYSARSDKWRMPDHFYAFERERSLFLALDTNMIMLGLGDAQGQRRFVRQELAKAPDAPWRIAFGHHPWKSNGQHGNAGNYEGARLEPTGLINGKVIKQFFVDELCGKIDLYINGHDHNRQWIESNACGVEYIVSGAGAKTTDLVDRDDNPTRWDDDASAGFTWIELSGNVATVAFFDADGALQHEGTIVK